MTQGEKVRELLREFRSSEANCCPGCETCTTEFGIMCYAAGLAQGREQERERCRLIAGKLGDLLAGSLRLMEVSAVCRMVIAIAHSIEEASYGKLEDFGFYTYYDNGRKVSMLGIRALASPVEPPREEK